MTPKEKILEESISLFDPDILKKIDFSKYQHKFNPPISLQQPGHNLIVRPLNSSDYNSGFLQILAELTQVGDVSKDQFMERFSSMFANPCTYYIAVIEDLSNGEVVGTGTLLLEKKFIRNCGVRGHIEDIVVSEKCRGKQLGKLIITTLLSLAEYFKCYKITLNCKDSNVKFYEGLGFTLEPGNGNYLQIRFKI
uniref:Glucosamine 6-phosphate N-acetyltransferase n=1 Tax=Clastoptera arizonana TaxID=38151 RepID=A0A1B6E2U9_9HEMI